MKKKGYDLDSLIKEQEEREQRISQAPYRQVEAEKEFIGTVEKYFSKLGVAAIKLDADISLGDIIEIGGKDEAIRQRITSMQIDRNDVSSARKGDSVGILVRCPVKEGEKVYKIY